MKKREMSMRVLLMPLVTGAIVLLTAGASAGLQGDIADAFVTGDGELNYNFISFELSNTQTTDRLDVFENGKLALTAFNPKTHKAEIDPILAKCKLLEADEPTSAKECYLNSRKFYLKRAFDYSISLSENTNLQLGENKLKLIFYNFDGTQTVRFFSFVLRGTVEKRGHYVVQKDIIESAADFSRVIEVADILSENYPGIMRTLVISSQGGQSSSTSAKVNSKSVTLMADDNLLWTAMIHEFTHLYWEEKLSAEQKRAYKALYDRLLTLPTAQEAILDFKEGTYVEDGGGHPQSNENEMFASMTTLMHLKRVDVLERVSRLPSEAQAIIKQMYTFLPKYRGI